MADYYVDNSGADGNGAIGTPWNNIANHVDDLAAGDVMHIRGGANAGARQVYAEDIQITAAAGCVAGTSGNPITIQNYTGEFIELQPSGGSGNRFVIELDYWTISGESTDYEIQYNKGDEGGYGIRVDGGDHVTIQYIELINAGYMGLGIEDADYFECGYCSVHDTEAIAYTDVHGIIVRGNSNYGEIHNLVGYNCHGDVIEVYRDDPGDTKLDWTIHDCTFYVEVAEASSVENPIGFKGGTNWEIYDCTFYGFRDADGSTGGSSGANGAAILFSDTIADAGAGTEIHDCLFYDMSGPAVMTGLADGIIAHHCVLRDMVDDGSSAWPYMFYVVGRSDNHRFENNTIVGDHGGRADARVIRALDATSYTIRNNIFTDTADFQEGTGVTITADHNCWDGASDTKAGTGDVTDDPLYTNEAGNDFSLQSGSPCIDAGVNVGWDYNGSAPDMGAYDYAETPSGPDRPSVNRSSVLVFG